MNEQTAKLMQQLAEKLGTTAEMLWAALLRQARIEAWCDIAIEVVLIGTTLGFAFSARKLWERQKDDDSGDWEQGAFLVCVFATIGFGSVALVTLMADFSEILSGFENPQYWALKQIIK